MVLYMHLNMIKGTQIRFVYGYSTAASE